LHAIAQTADDPITRRIAETAIAKDDKNKPSVVKTLNEAIKDEELEEIDKEIKNFFGE